MTLRLESHPDLETTAYTIATPGGHSLQAIALRPRETPPRATVVFIPGFGPDRVHLPGNESHFTPSAMAHLARAGFCALRVEKRGLGGSEGTHSQELGFVEEQHDLEAVMVSLDGPVVLFGHSLGALHAPIVAPLVKNLRGLLLYGTGLYTWTEYCDALLRRTANFLDLPPSETEEIIKAQQHFFAQVFHNHLSLDQLRERSPELAPYLHWFGVEKNYIHRRTEQYWREVYQCPIAQPLIACRAPIATVYGESDWLTFAEEHRAIATMVQQTHPGHGVFFSVPAVDHCLYAQPTQHTAFSARGHGRYAPEVIDTVLPWLISVTED